MWRSFRLPGNGTHIFTRALIQAQPHEIDQSLIGSSRQSSLDGTGLYIICIIFC